MTTESARRSLFQSIVRLKAWLPNHIRSLGSWIVGPSRHSNVPPPSPNEPASIRLSTSSLLLNSKDPKSFLLPLPKLNRQIHPHLPSCKPHPLILLHVHPRIIPLEQRAVGPLRAEVCRQLFGEVRVEVVLLGGEGVAEALVQGGPGGCEEGAGGQFAEEGAVEGAEVGHLWWVVGERDVRGFPMIFEKWGVLSFSFRSLFFPFEAGGRKFGRWGFERLEELHGRWFGRALIFW